MNHTRIFSISHGTYAHNLMTRIRAVLWLQSGELAQTVLNSKLPDAEIITTLQTCLLVAPKTAADLFTKEIIHDIKYFKC